MRPETGSLVGVGHHVDDDADACVDEVPLVGGQEVHHPGPRLGGGHTVTNTLNCGF